MYIIRRLLVLVAILAVGGCAHRSQDSQLAGADVVTTTEALVPFSRNATGEVPAGYSQMVLFRARRQTDYRIAEHDNNVVLHALSEGATSGLRQTVNIDATVRPWMQWRWKIGTQATHHDSTRRPTEASPARIVLGFDGDKETLTFGEQILFDTAKLITGHDLPFATLIYVWDSKRPVETVTQSQRSGRIRTIVVDQGPEGVGQWRTFTRNIVDDYKKAYGQPPGKLIAMGVLTDTDVEDETVEAWYGDIDFYGAPRVATVAK